MVALFMSQGLGGRTTYASELASKYVEVRFIAVIIVTRGWIMHARQFVTIVVVIKFDTSSRMYVAAMEALILHLFLHLF
jgi:hypothetical protein